MSRKWSKERRSAFNAKKKAEEKASIAAYREEWKNSFPFMFTKVKDEADAMSFLNAVILPDFKDWSQPVTPEELWGIIQQWSHHRRMTARMSRIIHGACEKWNSEVGKERAA